MTDEEQRPKCAGCGEAVDEDHLCFGCKNYVCDECDDGISSRAAQTFGPHDLNAHLEPAGEDYPGVF